ncbi:hypothetical protein PS639_06459 [Pseudomonas fluorescens]|nr:hypothetical protein PS639_06459 [Pseudomonas fluorescens]
MQGAGQRQAIGGGEYQVTRGLRLAPLQHAGIEVGGKEQFVRHPALERLQHQQLVVGVDAQHTDGADAAFAVASVGFVLAGNVVGEAPQVIELGVAVGFFQGAEIDLRDLFIFTRIGTGAFIVARGLLRQASVQPTQIAEAQNPLIDHVPVVVFVTAQARITGDLRLEAFDQGAAVETVPFGNQGNAIAAAAKVEGTGLQRALATTQTGGRIDTAQLQFLEHQPRHGAVVADGAQQLHGDPVFQRWRQFPVTALQGIVIGRGQR